MFLIINIQAKNTRYKQIEFNSVIRKHLTAGLQG